MNAIDIRGLRRAYDSFTLGPLDLTLPSGCIMGLIGENGAGKSTTIKLILDLIHQDEGTVTLLGKDHRDNLQLTKEEIGVVLDEVGISECLTARQVGNVMKQTFGRWDDVAFCQYLRRFSIPENRRFKELSRGMKMKLGIAVALSHHAKLLILDEAMSGLDPVARDEAIDCFVEFTRSEEHSILISSHIISDLEKLCDYIAFLHQGKLLLCEEKDKLKEKYGIVRCTKEQMETFDPSVVKGKKITPYGVEAIVRRDAVPEGMEISAVDIEQLFVLMVKEMECR